MNLGCDLEMTTESPPASDTHQAPPHSLLTTRQVTELLGIDRSTVYRMAADGRLPALKVGRQWRFPAHQLAEQFASLPDMPAASTTPQPTVAIPEPAETIALDAAVANQIIQLAADSLEVMMVVTDPDGVPVTDVANPEPSAVDADNNDTVLAAWREIVRKPQVAAHFSEGILGLICAKSPIRLHATTLGFVLAAARPAPAGLDPVQQQRIARLLPRVAQLITAVATTLSPHRPTAVRSEGQG